MSQFIRNVRSWALFHVSHKSDFWIQRTNPFDPSFSENEVYRKIEKSVSNLWPEHADRCDGIIRSAVMAAMDREKMNRIKVMKWDPYGIHDPNGPGTAFTG